MGQVARTELVDLAELRWYIPVRVGEGIPAFVLQGVPFRRCYLAFSTRQLCEAAIARWLTGCETRSVPSASFNAEAEGVGVQVVVDLEDLGDRWTLATVERVLLAPGGDA